MSTQPTCRVRLPTGDTITTTVLTRHRTSDGAWWYQLQATLYSPAEPTPGATATPEPATFWATADLVQPIPGQDYTTLDQPEPETWLLQPRPGKLPVIHHQHCWERGADAGTPITTSEALQLLQAGRAVVDGCSEAGLQAR